MSHDSPAGHKHSASLDDPVIRQRLEELGQSFAEDLEAAILQLDSDRSPIPLIDGVFDRDSNNFLLFGLPLPYLLVALSNHFTIEESVEEVMDPSRFERLLGAHRQRSDIGLHVQLGQRGLLLYIDFVNTYDIS